MVTSRFYQYSDCLLNFNLGFIAKTLDADAVLIKERILDSAQAST